MKILVAVDSNPYGANVAQEVGRLAVNTWADITILGLLPEADDNQENRRLLKKQLLTYRGTVLNSYREDPCPYARENGTDWQANTTGYDSYCPEGGMKRLQLLVGSGPSSRAILENSQREDCDLIMISCNKDDGCNWASGPVPLKVATEAECSVLVVKETKEPEQIVCCLDHDGITQYSVEMINQMVTLYQAELKIVGIANSDSLKEKVEQRLRQLLEYYSNLKLTPWLEVVDGSILPSFIAQESQKNLVALWADPKSLLNRFFPKKRMVSLLSDSPSSVLLLR